MATIAEALAQARQSYRAGDFQKAATLAGQILQVDPSQVEALDLLGGICLAQGRLAEAAGCYRRLLRLRPDASGHTNLGIVLFRLGQLDQALPQFREVLRLTPAAAAAHNNLGLILKEQGQTVEAEACFRAALRLKPSLAEAHSNLGLALKAQGKLDEALASLRQAQNLKPDSPEVHNNLGLVHKDMERLEEALAGYREAIRLRPGYAEAHSNLGNALRELGRLVEAAASLGVARRLHPGSAETLSNLGLVLKDQGKLDEALATLRQALQLRPGSARIHTNLGLVLQLQGRLREAVVQLEQAVRCEPTDAEAQGLLGSALLDQGRVDEANAHLQQAVRLQPDLPAAQANLEHGLRLKAHQDRLNRRSRLLIATEPSAGAPHRQPTCYLLLPWGKSFGWGICGKAITRELARLTRVRLITQILNRQRAADEPEYRFVIEQLASQEEIELLERHNDRHPVLQAITDTQLNPFRGRVTVPYKIGYTFCEYLMTETDVKAAAGYFDVVAAGSSWCAARLREKGCPQAIPVLQGIDPLTFNPLFAEKELFADRFVVFSGGKFEFRKGQDIVIRAYRALQDKHADVMLINGWFNSWPRTSRSMAASPHIRFDCKPGDHVSTINRMLADNGIDLDRVLTLPFYPNESLARIYQNTDVGLFPNRCEGGTNLVLMEYMACGKPVIASFSSGHKDIVTRDNAILIENLRSVTVGDRQAPSAVWDDPDLEETIAHLEWAYQHRQELKKLGQQAGQHLTHFTWRHTAEQFYRLLCQGPLTTGAAG